MEFRVIGLCDAPVPGGGLCNQRYGHLGEHSRDYMPRPGTLSEQEWLAASGQVPYGTV